jgi:pimeloyl-ACP methyl ester carboxylesterase
MRLAHTIHGSGPIKLILAHPLGSSGSFFDSVIPHLGASFQVLAFDARGMGSSPCPPGPYTWSELCNDTVSLINEVFGQQSKVALLGVSMGGMLAQHLASAEYLGSRLSHVVLVSTTGSTAGQEAVWKQRRALLNVVC